MSMQYGGSRHDDREQSSADGHSDGLLCAAVGLSAILLVALIARGDAGGNAGPANATANSPSQLTFVF